jgi:hypothetical protein
MRHPLQAIVPGVLFALLGCGGKGTQETPRPVLPTLVSQPQNLAITIGTTATFTVNADGGASYQWSSALFDGTGAVTAWLPITGATAASYSFATSAEDVKTPLPQFRVEVFDATRTISATSAAATLSIVVPKGYPLFSSQPQATVVAPGGSASFTVVNAGSPAPTLQWQKNGVDIAGATAATLTLPGVTSADNGARFRCVATNPLGINPSREATLTVGVEMLKNGGFEDGFSQTAWINSGGTTKPSSWQKMFGDSTATSRLTVRTGSYYLYLGNVSTGTPAAPVADYAYQDVAIDAKATYAALSWAWAIRSNAVKVGDVTLNVEIRDTSNALLATAKSLDAKTVGATTSPAPWQPLETFNLLPYKGRTVRICFTSIDTGNYAYIGVDDVSVIVAK